MENDFFKDFGQKWKVRNGAVVFQKTFVKSIRAKHSLSEHAKSCHRARIRKDSQSKL